MRKPVFKLGTLVFVAVVFASIVDGCSAEKIEPSQNADASGIHDNNGPQLETCTS